MPLAGTPLDTTNNVRLYYTTITALGFKEKSNGIILEDIEDNHFFLVFELTSTEEASKNFTLSQEHTGRRLTLKLYFEKALDDAIEVFLIGERFSQVTIDSARNIKKTGLTMNSATLQHLIIPDPNLSVAFAGIWSSDNFIK